MKWNYKLLGKTTGIQGQSAVDESAQVSYKNNEKLVRHELYIPPKLSLHDYFLKKVISYLYYCEQFTAFKQKHEISFTI